MRDFNNQPKVANKANLWLTPQMTDETQTILKYILETRGGPAGLASKLKLSKQAVGKWKCVPHKRVLDVEKITGISRHDIRPDIYPLDGNYNNSEAEDEDAA